MLVVSLASSASSPCIALSSHTLEFAQNLTVSRPLFFNKLPERGVLTSKCIAVCYCLFQGSSKGIWGRCMLL